MRSVSTTGGVMVVLVSAWATVVMELEELVELAELVVFAELDEVVEITVAEVVDEFEDVPAQAVKDNEIVRSVRNTEAPRTTIRARDLAWLPGRVS